jgi:3-deoxy-manno-octulosonate cytidylyltransferase (CMP-KDO synthetase)
MKVLGLIPSRLGSTRLKKKPLLKIGNLPIIVHTYRRAKISKKLDDLWVCCDDKKIKLVCDKYRVKSILTSKKHKNGTERIAEAYLMLKKKFDLIVDIQGDEPLLDPKHIDIIVDFHKKNMKSDIILPTLKSFKKSGKNVVKVIKSSSNKVLYLSRENLPFEFRNKNNISFKHLSIISFKPQSLIKFYKSKQTFLEKIEGVELLRALELDMNIKSIELSGNSFSVDIHKDYLAAKKYILKDKLYKKYKTE